MITSDRRVVFDVVARVAATAVAARVVDCVSAACIVVGCAARAIHGDERGGDRDARGVPRATGRGSIPSYRPQAHHRTDWRYR